jgi:hypothetical protein
MVPPDSKSYEVYRWMLKTDQGSRLKEIAQSSAELPMFPPNHDELSAYVTKHRAMFEAEWAADLLGREWIEAMAQSTPEGLYPNQGIDSPLLSFSVIRRSVTIRWAHAQLLWLDGHSDEATRTLVPILRAGYHLQRGSLSLVKHPAIIWLTGGFSNSIGDIAWTPGPASNDQSASGFRDAGIVMMYPPLRGGNNNPGYIETFYGEVDDVLAAAKALATLDYVDPKRIYLGGHSTGGTLALLVAAAGGDRFRAVFALGPVDNVVGYGADVLPFDLKNPKEAQVRAPVVWVSSIP